MPGLLRSYITSSLDRGRLTASLRKNQDSAQSFVLRTNYIKMPGHILREGLQAIFPAKILFQSPLSKLLLLKKKILQVSVFPKMPVAVKLKSGIV